MEEGSRSRSLNIVNNNTEWNKKIENVLRILKNQCVEYKKMHFEIHTTSERIYSSLMISSIVLTPLSGIITSVGMMLCDDILDLQYYTCASTILSFVAGIIISITKFSKYDKTSQAHLTAASRYTSLENNIERQLFLDAKNRISAQKYLDWIIKNFDDLYTSSPVVKNDKLNKYSKFIDLYNDEITDSHEVKTTTDEKHDPIKRVSLSKIKNDKNNKSSIFTTHQDLLKYDDELMKLSYQSDAV